MVCTAAVKDDTQLKLHQLLHARHHTQLVCSLQGRVCQPAGVYGINTQQPSTQCTREAHVVDADSTPQQYTDLMVS